jgi:hypothetical protein
MTAKHNAYETEWCILLAVHCQTQCVRISCTGDSKA